MSTAATKNTTPPAPAKSTGYDVARPHGLCNVSGEPIKPGERFMAALRETPMGFERVDISLSHWPNYDHKDLLAFWQTVMPLHEEKKKIFVDDTILAELFERLGSATEPNKVSFRFVLGLILMRKRLLIYDETVHVEGRDIWRVRLKGREDKLDLADPKLDEQQMMDVSKQLSEILNEEL